MIRTIKGLNTVIVSVCAAAAMAFTFNYVKPMTKASVETKPILRFDGYYINKKTNPDGSTELHILKFHPNNTVIEIKTIVDPQKQLNIQKLGEWFNPGENTGSLVIPTGEFTKDENTITFSTHADYEKLTEIPGDIVQIEYNGDIQFNRLKLHFKNLQTLEEYSNVEFNYISIDQEKY